MPRYTSRVVWSGAEIQRRRNRRGISQQQLADAIGAARRTVIAWEAGTATPHAKWIHKLEEELAEPGESPRVTAAPSESRRGSTGSDDQGPLLRDADFAQTINHLVDLHNEAIRNGMHQVLRAGEVPPPNFEEHHDVRSGPPRSAQQSSTESQRASDA